MTKEELTRILDKHQKWLNDEPGGECANLVNANLRDAHLIHTDLSSADLRNADLRGTDLRHADLRHADLRGTDLRHAKLIDADLRDADLRDADLSSANLRYDDLSGANLSSANLSSADLRNADLKGTNLDFSAFPLWCGGLDVHIDDRLAIQLLYHLLRNVQYSKNTSEEMKKTLCTPELIGLANRFHRVEECGRIGVQEEAEA